MNKTILLSLVIVSSLVFTGCTAQNNTEVISQLAKNIKDHQIVELKFDDRSLFVEAVTSPESITLGLGNRDEIGSDGMLFVLPDRQVANFWMHGMRFDLDMVWIDGSTIVGIAKNARAPENPNSMALPTYSSEVPVTHVLELPAGKSDQLNLQIGNTVQFVF